MHICITTTGQGLDAEVDPRFGRCQYFTIVDTDTMQFEFIENVNIAVSGGAGIQSAKFVANKGVDAVLTGNVGPNAYETLNAVGISVITGVSGGVRQVVEDYKRGRLGSPASGSSVGSHFGIGGGTGLDQPLKVNELETLREKSQILRAQLDKVMEEIKKHETEKNSSPEIQVMGIKKTKKALKERLNATDFTYSEDTDFDMTPILFSGCQR